MSRFSCLDLVNSNRFSQNLVCALILWRSDLKLLMDKVHQIVAGYYRFMFLFVIARQTSYRHFLSMLLPGGKLPGSSVLALL